LLVVLRCTFVDFEFISKIKFFDDDLRVLSMITQ
jgi:hypothetical protein